jgi:hypothetical protein
MANKITATMTATAPAAIGTRRSMRRRLCRWPGCKATSPAAALAIEMPQPGHQPAPRAQHRPHANTPHDGHFDSPIPARVAAGPIRLPQRSQNGSCAPPEG